MLITLMAIRKIIDEWEKIKDKIGPEVLKDLSIRISLTKVGSVEALSASKYNTLIQFAKEAIEVVRDCEAIIDAANGVYGSTQPTHALCLICRSNEYNSEVGIVHDDKCPVKQIRNFKEKWNKE